MLKHTCVLAEDKACTISVCCTHIKGDQPLLTILLDSCFKGLSPQPEVFVCRQKSQLHAPKQTGSFHRRMRLIYTHTQRNKLVTYTVAPPYLLVIRSKTYRGYVKSRIIPNAIYNVIFV
jgi:hypothetical protein